MGFLYIIIQISISHLLALPKNLSISKLNVVTTKPIVKTLYIARNILHK